MLTKKTILTSAFVSMLFVSVGAYAKYLQVTDNTTGQVYLTKDIDHTACGPIIFKDARTGDKVTLQSATVTKISKDQWKQELRTCPPPTPIYKQEMRLNPPAEYQRPQCPGSRY